MGSSIQHARYLNPWVVTSLLPRESRHVLTSQGLVRRLMPLNMALLPGAVGLTHGGMGLTLGYRELLWKLKTKAAGQHHQLQAALENAGGRQRGYQEGPQTPRLASLMAVPVRVFKQNSVLSKLTSTLLRVRGEVRGAASEVRHLATATAAAAAGRVRLQPPPAATTTSTTAAAAAVETSSSLASRHATWVEAGVRPVLLAALGVVCKTWMHGLNTTTVHGGERLQAALQNRQHGQGLVRPCPRLLSPPLSVSPHPPPWLAQSHVAAWRLHLSI
jgi:hypothetical protein